jgi:cytochrome c peroxidase
MTTPLSLSCSTFTFCLAISLSACGGGSVGAGENSIDTTGSAKHVQQTIELGEQLFNDTQLSSTKTVSCQSCHNSSLNAYSDGRPNNRVSAGVNGLVTTRNAPALAYSAFVPMLQQIDDDGEPLWIGGLFHDGRADTLTEQAFGPLLGSNEMGNASPRDVLIALRDSSTSFSIDGTPYSAADAFRQVFGAASLPNDLNSLSDSDVIASLTQLTSALAAFQSTPEFSPFTSKYDYFLKGKTKLSPSETRGLAAFARVDRGNCAACHTIDRNTPNGLPLFTDFSYDNLGLASVTGDNIDNGLANNVKVAGDQTLLGKFRVPTLRNVAVTGPYMHNGVFTTLKEVVEFYSDRDKNPPATDFPATTNRSELGNLGLSSQEVEDIVAFMNTLSDGFTP